MASAHLSRRDMLRLTAAAGFAAPVAACAAGGGGNSTDQTTGKSAANPFGAADGDTLEVVVFDGGLGDAYVRYAENLYGAKYPKSAGKITHEAIQTISGTLKPRFANGTPPDLVDDSGADQIPLDSLQAAGELTDLTPLLDAPSYDDSTVRVRDTLRPGTVDVGSYNGVMYELNYAYTAYGIWYSNTLFQQRGWEYPTTWDGFIALCDTIQKAGISPWIHQGKYPDYMTYPMMDMAYKAGGPEVALNIDNLEPNAWRHPAVLAAVTAFHELVAKGYVYPGAAGLTHIQSQTLWNEGKAALIPCGTWLPNEQKAETPAGFDMVMKPGPSLSGTDRLPYGTLRAAAGEPYIVPSKAKNAAGAMELLRLMLSQKASANFATATNSLSAMKNAGSSLTGVTIASEEAALSAAGDNIVTYDYINWYADLHTASENATGELMAGRSTPAQWVSSMQAAADTVAKDGSITKYHRSK